MCGTNRHGQCMRRSPATGDCSCLECWSVHDSELAMIAYAQATSPKELRYALGRMLAYRHQVRHRQAVRASRDQVLPPYPCACGRDGCMVVGARPYGRRTLYAGRPCRQAAYRARVRSKARTESYSGSDSPALPMVWPDRDSFDAYWADQINGE